MDVDYKVSASPIPDLTELDEYNFWSRVKVGDTESCWPWLGSRSSLYGVLSLRVPDTKTGWRSYKAHRISYFLTHGCIDNDLVVDHICENEICVNPGHLQQITAKENTQKGKAPSAIAARATRAAQK